MKKKNSILRITIIAGLILTVISCILLLIVFFIGRRSNPTSRQQSSFYDVLREYDISYQNSERDYAKLHNELDRLERLTISVETWLSVLKRRRTLSEVSPSSREEYRRSIHRALRDYPQSQYINALAAADMIKNTALNNRTEDALRDCLQILTDPVFNELRLDFHILLGDFRNPETALVIPQDILFYNYVTDENIAINLTLLKIIRGYANAAAADIQIMLNDAASDKSASSENAIRFAAEYYYDFGDLNFSAELFSMLEGDAALLRQADALYLAGYTDSARVLWSLLSNESGFYNLALTSENNNERFLYLSSLYQAENYRINTLPVLAGIIHYSRLLEFERAILVLDSVQKPGRFHHPLIDLELNRRQSLQQEPARRVAEAWLLLDRHPENTDLYNWAAWLMLTQRSFNELSILMNRIDNYQNTEKFYEWLPLYKAAFFMHEGYLDTAESYLRSLSGETSPWYINANLARIHEARHSYNRAIEQFEIASQKVQDARLASRIELQIARANSALGRRSDAIDSFRYAIELDPENISARHELDRIISGN